MKVRIRLAWIEFSHGCKRAWRTLRGRPRASSITNLQADELLAVTRRHDAMREGMVEIAKAVGGDLLVQRISEGLAQQFKDQQDDD